MRKTVVEEDQTSRNETILKIGHLAKAIAQAKGRAFAKWSGLGE